MQHELIKQEININQVQYYTPTNFCYQPRYDAWFTYLIINEISTLS